MLFFYSFILKWILSGIGPVPAIQALLKKNNLTKEKIDLFDVNQAFASQAIAVSKELGLNPENTNVNGGAIALGHPLAASGTRITANLVYELARRKVTNLNCLILLELSWKIFVVLRVVML